jgi:hypothetical protein
MKDEDEAYGKGVENDNKELQQQQRVERKRAEMTERNDKRGVITCTRVRGVARYNITSLLLIVTTRHACKPQTSD